MLVLVTFIGGEGQNSEDIHIAKCASFHRESTAESRCREQVWRLREREAKAAGGCVESCLLSIYMKPIRHGDVEAQDVMVQ